MKHKIIAVDFDGTLVTDKYPKIGEPNVKLINKLRKLSKDNTLILWTCRNGEKLKEAVEFCLLCDLHFDYINENSKETLKKYKYKDSRKISADIYIDNRARTTL